MSKLFVLIEVRGNGRHCARDCPHLRTFVEEAATCSLFACSLTYSPMPPDQRGLRKILRSKPCRDAEHKPATP